MSDLPLVSIVTPSYNQGEFLEQTILSVLRQDYPNIEYLVIDGGSDDGSQQIISGYADRLAYWESQPDRGQAHAINKGLRRASGEVLGWVNSDDVLMPHTVSHVVACLLQNPAIDVVYGRVERINTQSQPVPTPRLPKDDLLFGKQYVIGECIVNQAGAFWKRTMMEKAGLLDESLAYALDYEYWIRLALAGAQFFHLNEILAHFRLSTASKTVSQSTEMALEQLQILDQTLAQPDIGAKLCLSSAQVAQKARRARAILSLHGFYGAARKGDWHAAVIWLSRALRSDPGVIMQRRWLSLALAGLYRRILA